MDSTYKAVFFTYCSLDGAPVGGDDSNSAPLTSVGPILLDPTSFGLVPSQDGNSILADVFGSGNGMGDGGNPEEFDDPSQYCITAHSADLLTYTNSIPVYLGKRQGNGAVEEAFVYMKSFADLGGVPGRITLASDYQGGGTCEASVINVKTPFNYYHPDHVNQGADGEQAAELEGLFLDDYDFNWQQPGAAGDATMVTHETDFISVDYADGDLPADMTGLGSGFSQDLLFEVSSSLHGDFTPGASSGPTGSGMITYRVDGNTYGFGFTPTTQADGTLDVSFFVLQSGSVLIEPIHPAGVKFKFTQTEWDPDENPHAQLSVAMVSNVADDRWVIGDYFPIACYSVLHTNPWLYGNEVYGNEYNQCNCREIAPWHFKCEKEVITGCASVNDSEALTAIDDDSTISEWEDGDGFGAYGPWYLSLYELGDVPPAALPAPENEPNNVIWWTESFLLYGKETHPSGLRCVEYTMTRVEPNVVDHTMSLPTDFLNGLQTDEFTLQDYVQYCCPIKWDCLEGECAEVWARGWHDNSTNDCAAELTYQISCDEENVSFKVEGGCATLADIQVKITKHDYQYEFFTPNTCIGVGNQTITDSVLLPKQTLAHLGANFDEWNVAAPTNWTCSTAEQKEDIDPVYCNSLYDTFTLDVWFKGEKVGSKMQYRNNCCDSTPPPTPEVAECVPCPGGQSIQDVDCCPPQTTNDPHVTTFFGKKYDM